MSTSTPPTSSTATSITATRSPHTRRRARRSTAPSSWVRTTSTASWGYTALTRHRDEARFYLVSLGTTERCLPGIEPEHDPLVQDIGDMLGDSRQKSLAIDLLADDQPADDPASRTAAREHA